MQYSRRNFLSLLSFLSLALLGFATLFLSSCAGYKVGPQPPSELRLVKTIAVPTAENLTLEPKLAPIVTSQVVSALAAEGTYRIGQVESADAVLEISITKIERRQARSVRDNLFRSSELVLVLVAEYELKANDSMGSVLRRGKVRGTSSVFTQENFQTVEADALQDVARILANEVIVKLANGW